MIRPQDGYVVSVRDGICVVSGLARARAGEIVYISKTEDFVFSPNFKGNNSPERQELCRFKKVERAAKFSERYMKGLVLNLNEGYIGIMVLGNDRLIAQGSLVLGTSTLLKINTSLAFFGHVLNSLGDFLDDEDVGKFVRVIDKNNTLFSIDFERDDANIRKLTLEDRNFVEKKATGIIDRVPVRVPLLTGLTSVDSLVPIGRGQRELIIGDKQTGKTSIAIDAILNHVAINNHYLGIDQKKAELVYESLNTNNISLRNIEVNLDELRNIVWFVYCGIGQKQSTINNLRTKLQKKSAFWFTSIVSATSAESAPLQFLAPYTSCTLGEFIRDRVGGDCVVVFDDLSKHAVAYRQMSLLLRRPPGREAFPGDVFYVHSRLLERAGALTDKKIQLQNSTSSDINVLRRGTLTAFPVIETQAGDVSAYIPTNVISITDGQIFLETELFYRGVRPAINVGLSVSRVGSAAQPLLMKNVSGSLKMELAQYREIEGFAKLGANLDDHTKKLLTRGENLIEVLKQDLHNPLNTFNQSLNIFSGVGFSGKLASRLNLFKKYVSLRSNGTTSTIPSTLLFNSSFITTSWLEYLRLKSNDFTINDVRLFLSGMLHFVKRIGIFNLFAYKSVYDITNFLLAKAPFTFLNDLFLLYFIDFGTLSADSFDSQEGDVSINSIFERNYLNTGLRVEEFFINNNLSLLKEVDSKIIKNTKIDVGLRSLFEGGIIVENVSISKPLAKKSQKFIELDPTKLEEFVLNVYDRVTKKISQKVYFILTKLIFSALSVLNPVNFIESSNIVKGFWFGESRRFEHLHFTNLIRGIKEVSPIENSESDFDVVVSPIVVYGESKSSRYDAFSARWKRKSNHANVNSEFNEEGNGLIDEGEATEFVFDLEESFKVLSRNGEVIEILENALSRASFVCEQFYSIFEFKVKGSFIN